MWFLGRKISQSIWKWLITGLLHNFQQSKTQTCSVYNDITNNPVICFTQSINHHSWSVSDTPSPVWCWCFWPLLPSLYQLPLLIFNKLSHTDATAKLVSLTFPTVMSAVLNREPDKEVGSNGGVWWKAWDEEAEGEGRRRLSVCQGRKHLLRPLHRKSGVDTVVCASDPNSWRRCRRCQK